MILHGTYPLPSRAGVVPLSDGAGEVTAVGISRQFVGSRTDLETMVDAIEANRLRPIIDRTFPFHDARKAYAYAERGDLFGKVVIEGA